MSRACATVPVMKFDLHFYPQHPEVALVVRGFNRVENGEVLTDSFITAEGVRREFEKVRNALNRAESRALKAVFDEEVVKRMDERYKIG